MSSPQTLDIQEGVDESHEDAWLNFDEQCHYYLGISAKAFIAAYKNGDLIDDDTPENFNVGRLASLLDLFP